MDGDYIKLADDAFAALGTPHMAYVKPVRKGDVWLFEVRGADGRVMGTAAAPEVAVAAILQHDMVPVSIH